MKPRLAFKAVAVGIAATLTPALAWCQTSQFAPGTAQVIRATDFVQEAPGVQFAFGSDLKLTLQTSNATAKAFAHKPFRVRIFPLDAAEQADARAFFDPCHVFRASVTERFQVKSGSVINIGPLSQLGWLTLTRGAPPRPGRYLLVFEDGTDPEWLFRLNKGDRALYFSLGLRIEVLPPPALTPAAVNNELARQEAEAHLIRVDAKDNTSAHRCYRAQRFAGASAIATDTTLLKLEAC